jgi:hypothetical protein
VTDGFWLIMLLVSRSTYPECGAVRQPNGEVCKDCQQAIAHWGPEGQVMRDLMDREE